MFCTQCGAQREDPSVGVCPKCGAAYIAGVPGTPARAGKEEVGALRLLIPINRNIIAVIAGYVGIFSLLILPGPLALILGIIALVQLKHRPQQFGRGRAWFAVIIGALASILLLVFLASVLFTPRTHR